MKRAFVDVTLELLANLLHLNGGTMIVHAEPRMERGATLRLYLHGDGLPEKTEVKEGFPSVQLESLSEVIVPDEFRSDSKPSLQTDNPGPMESALKTWLREGGRIKVSHHDYSIEVDVPRKDPISAMP